MASTPKIPLKCDICPKKPRFSDVSHLLTHISSKTHLSNIFKARVRLEIDVESRQLIEDYDQWYAEWNIQDLLAERMNQKENKVVKPRGRGGGKSGQGRRRRSSNPATSGQPGVPPVDPRLPPYPGPLNSLPYPNLAHPSMQGGYVPYFQPTHRGPPTQWSMMQTQIPHPVTVPHFAITGTAAGDQGRGSGPLSETGGKKRRAAAEICNKRLKMIRVDTRDNSETPTAVSETVEDSDDDDDDTKSTPVDTESGEQFVIVDGDDQQWPNMTVKGMVWGGMGCFDAAPPAQRSQRNQKKTNESYMMLWISSTKTADAPFEVIFKILDDGVWILVKSRIITGNPSPSSIASSSPTRVSPPKRTLRQRYAREQSIATNGDEANDLDIHRAVFGIRRGKIPVLRQEDYDDETASVNTFLGRPRGGNRFDIGARNKLNQENEQTDSISAHATIKTDFDEVDSSAHVALPSIERTAGMPRDMGYEDTFMGPMRHTPTLPPPSPFLQSSPQAPFSLNGHNNGPYHRYVSGHHLMPNSLSQHGPMPPVFHSPAASHTHTFGTYPPPRPTLGFGGYQNGIHGSHTNSRLDNLATVASDFNHQLSMFDNTLPNASPSHNSQFFANQMSPGYGALGSTLPGPDWLRASPGQQSNGFHGRHSSQTWRMHAPVHMSNRRAGFMDTQEQHNPFVDTKPMHETLGAGQSDAIPQSSMHQVPFGQYRLTSNNTFSGWGGYGLTGGPDSKTEDPQVLLPPLSTTVNTFSLTTSAPADAAAHAPAAEPTTPLAPRLILPPPLPGSRGSPRGHTPLDPSRTNREHGRYLHAAPTIASPSNRFEEGAPVDGGYDQTGIESPFPGDQKHAPAAGGAVMGDNTGDASSDDGRTITAPGTPTVQA